MKPSLRIAKTIKLYIGGNFPRTESGRSFPIYRHGTKEIYANLCLGSRKDIRMAVEVAGKAQGAWGGKSAYNRSQILYRMAEMTEGKRVEFNEVLQAVYGLSPEDADRETDGAIDAFVYYAGFADKFPQVTSAVNPVNGPYHNFTSPDAVGVVGLITDEDFNFARLISQICSILCGGNSTVVLLNEVHSALLAPLAEVFATSDLPGGVVNLISGSVEELYRILAGHMEVHGLTYQGQNPEIFQEIKSMAVENMKRVVPRIENANSLESIMYFTEARTVWHPIGY